MDAVSLPTKFLVNTLVARIQWEPSIDFYPVIQQVNIMADVTTRNNGIGLCLHSLYLSEVVTGFLLLEDANPLFEPIPFTDHTRHASDLKFLHGGLCG